MDVYDDSDGLVADNRSASGSYYFTTGVEVCPPCGDVNMDGEITPDDALCAFQEYLGIPSCINGDPCKLAEADVTLNGEITPADALCIFQRYLGLPSCLDGRPKCPWD